MFEDGAYIQSEELLESYAELPYRDLGGDLIQFEDAQQSKIIFWNSSFSCRRRLLEDDTVPE